ncbi:MAG: DUF2065 domain-containing protein [Thiotrichaceae bacterium]
MSINWDDLLNAIALVMIIEGILPFVSPESLKKTYQKMQELPDDTLRKVGVGSIVLGMLLLFLH